MIGVNLTRAACGLQQGAYNANVREEAVAAQRGGRGQSLAFYIGGPVASKIGHAVSVVTAEGAAVASEYDVCVVRAGLDGDALVFGKTRAVVECAAEYGAARMGNVEYAASDGRPPPWEPPAGSNFLSEPTVHTCVFQGHATWSRQQLMGEITRGSWGVIDISNTPLFELYNREAASQQRARDEASAPPPVDVGRRMWETLSAAPELRFTLPNPMQEEFLRGRSALLAQDQQRAAAAREVGVPSDMSAADGARQVASAAVTNAVAAAAAVGSELEGRGGGEGREAGRRTSSEGSDAEASTRMRMLMGQEAGGARLMSPGPAALAAAAAAREVAAAAVAAAAAATEREAEVETLQEVVATAAALAAAAAATAIVDSAVPSEGERGEREETAGGTGSGSEGGTPSFAEPAA